MWLLFGDVPLKVVFSGKPTRINCFLQSSQEWSSHPSLNYNQTSITGRKLTLPLWHLNKTNVSVECRDSEPERIPLHQEMSHNFSIELFAASFQLLRRLPRLSGIHWPWFALSNQQDHLLPRGKSTLLHTSACANWKDLLLSFQRDLVVCAAKFESFNY